MVERGKGGEDRVRFAETESYEAWLLALGLTRPTEKNQPENPQPADQPPAPDQQQPPNDEPPSNQS